MPFHDPNRPDYARADLCETHDPYRPILTALFRVELADYAAGEGVLCHTVMVPVSWCFGGNDARKEGMAKLNAYIERRKFVCYGTVGDPSLPEGLHAQNCFLQSVKEQFLDHLAELLRGVQYETYPLVCRVAIAGHHATTIEYLYS